jgi:hypothetical protein
MRELLLLFRLFTKVSANRVIRPDYGMANAKPSRPVAAYP